MSKKSFSFNEIYSDGFLAIPRHFLKNYRNKLSPSEFVVMICIFEKTLGFQKLEDQISLSQLVELSGITKKTCINCLKSLEEQNFIFINRSTKEKVDQTNLIKINIKKLFAGSVEITLRECNQSNLYSVKITHTKETKQYKREFFSFEKKEEYPEIPLENNEMLQNAQNLDFKAVNTLS
jgi:phage replication O-like protein O